MLIDIIKKSLVLLKDPYFYATERGFQAELYSELRRQLPSLMIDGALFEQEAQKKIKLHGLNIRPDIILHIPYKGSNYASPREGNLAVIELKCAASQRQAFQDFENLSRMCEILNYPLGVFINIGSQETFLADYRGPKKNNLFSIATQIIDGYVSLHEYGEENPRNSKVP